MDIDDIMPRTSLRMNNRLYLKAKAKAKQKNLTFNKYCIFYVTLESKIDYILDEMNNTLNETKNNFSEKTSPEKEIKECFDIFNEKHFTKLKEAKKDIENILKYYNYFINDVVIELIKIKEKNNIKMDDFYKFCDVIDEFELRYKNGYLE